MSSTPTDADDRRRALSRLWRRKSPEPRSPVTRYLPAGFPDTKYPDQHFVNFADESRVRKDGLLTHPKWVWVVAWSPAMIFGCHAIITITRQNDRSDDLSYAPQLAAARGIILATLVLVILVLYMLRWKRWQLIIRLSLLICTVALPIVLVDKLSFDDTSDWLDVAAMLVMLFAALFTIVSVGQSPARWQRHWWFDLGRDAKRARMRREGYAAFVLFTIGFVVATWTIRTDWDTVCGPRGKGLKTLQDFLLLSDNCGAAKTWGEWLGFGLIASALILASTAFADRPDIGVPYSGDNDTALGEQRRQRLNAAGQAIQTVGAMSRWEWVRHHSRVRQQMASAAALLREEAARDPVTGSRSNSNGSYLDEDV